MADPKAKPAVPKKPTQKWVPEYNREKELVDYLLGDVIGENADGTTTVRVLGTQERKIKTSELDELDVNPKKFDKVDDMADMGFLSPATVLFNLRERFAANMIYTYSGLFLVAVNPYKLLPLYTDKVIESYKGKRRTEIGPHVFAIADQAYRQMMDHRENQSVLITGESGAGKTVNTKRVLQYLAYIAGTKGASGKGELEEQLLQSNPILEAWGNAKTTRNNNSSRFGKFIEVQFNAEGRIAGGSIESYLLEKSRVSFQAEEERNYHIFYYLLKAAPADMRRDLKLTEVKDYVWVSVKTQDVPGLDDNEDYQAMMTAFETMGMPMSEVMMLFKITSSILHMGNASRLFEASKRTEEAVATEACQAEIAIVEELLGIEREKLLQAVLRPRMKAGVEWVNKQRTATQAKNLMEALARSIFDRMFSWIVHRINQTLQNKNKREMFIGVLDISGFEIFKVNSFEQLCINYTNERLQQFFNNHMFKLEQEEYLREQIEWTMIDFGNDLQGTIDLIELPKNPLGILAILEDQCNFPKATDESFVAKMVDVHGAGKHPNFIVPKFAKNKFSVKHYAGMVDYISDDWLEKNRDKLDDPIAVVMQDSKDEFIAKLFEDLTPEREGKARMASEGGKRAPRPYVSVGHKAQLEKLMGMLRATSPHFIRCIKPNEQKRPLFIEAQMVLDQLRCNGVIEGIRITRKGYPNRLRFGEFRDRYKVCAPGKVPDSLLDSKEATRIILEHLKMDTTQYKIGLTKVFFKAGRLPELEELRDKILGELLKGFQSLLRGCWARQRYQVQVENSRAVAILQQSIQTYFQMRNWPWFRLFSKIRPMIKIVDKEAEREAREAEMAKLRAAEEAERKARETAVLEAEALKKQMEERQKQSDAEKERLRKAREEEIKHEREEKERLKNEAAEAVRRAEEKRREDSDRLRAEMERNRAELEERGEAEKRALLEKAQAEKERLAKEKEAERKMYEEKRLQTERELDKKSKEFEAASAKTTKQLLQEQEERKTEYERRIKLEDDLKRLERKLANKEDELETERKERTAIETVKKKMEQDLKNAKSALSQEQTEKSKLEDQRKSIEGKLDELALEVQAKEEAATRIQKQKSSAEKEMEDLQDQLQSEEKSVVETKRQLQKAQKEIQDLKARLSDAEQSKAKYQRDKRKLEAKLKSGVLVADGAAPEAGAGGLVLRASTDTETRKLQQEIRRLRERLVTAEAQKQAIERNIEDYRNELDELRSALEDETKARIEADREVRDLRDQMRETNELLDERAQEMEDEATLRKAQEEELAEARRMVAEVGDTHLKDIEAKRKKWEEAIAELRDQLDQEAKEKAELQKSLNKAKEEHQGILDRVDESERHVRLANQARTKIENQYSTVKDELAEIERQLHQAQAVAKKATGETSGLQDEIDALKREKAQAVKAQRSLEVEVADLKRVAEEEVKARQEVESQLAQQSDEAREHGDRAEDAEEESERLKDEVKRQLEEIEMLRASKGQGAATGESEETRGQLAALEQELAELREDLEEERRKRAAADRQRRQTQTLLDEVEDKLQSQIANNDALASSKKLVEADLKAAKQQLTGMQDQALKSEIALKEMDAKQAEIAQLSAQLEASRDHEVKERKSAQQKLKEVEDKMNEAVAQTELVERSKKALQEEIDAVKEELEDVREERMKVEDLKRQQLAELTALRAELDKQGDPRAVQLEQEKNKILIELDEARLQTKEAVKNEQNMERQLRKVQEDHKSANTQLQETVASLRAAEKLAKKHQEDSGKNAAKVAQQKKDIATAQREAQSAANQRDELKARVQILEKAKISLEASKHHLDLQLEDLRDAMRVEGEMKAAQIVKRREMEEEVARLQKELKSGTGTTEALDELRRQHILEIAEVKKKQAAEFAVQIEALENAKREARAKMEEAKERFDASEREKSALEKQTERAQREASDAVSRLDDEIKSRVELEKANRLLVSENKEKTHKAAMNQAQFEQAQEEKKTLLAQANEAAGKLDEAERRTAVAEAQFQQANAELEGLKTECDDLSVKNKELEDQIKALRTELEDVMARLDDEISQRGEWEAIKDAKEELIVELQERIEAEKQENQQALEELRKALVKEAKELSERCESGEKHILELEKENRRLASVFDQKTDDLNSANRDKIELEKALNKLQTEVMVKSKALLEESQLRTEAEGAFKRLKIENTDVVEQLNFEKQGKDKLVSNHKATEKRLQIALMELEDERTAFASLERTSHDCLDQLEDVREKLESSEANARSVDQVTVKLEQEISALNEELMRTDESNARLEKTISAMKREIMQLKTHLDRADGLGKNAMDKAKARLEEKIADLTTRLTAETQAKLEQQKANRQIGSETRKAKKEATSATKKARRLEKSLSKADKRIDQMKEELEAAVAELAASEKEKRDLKRGAQDWIESKSTLEKDNERLKKTLEREKKRFFEIEVQLKALASLTALASSQETGEDGPQ